MGYSGLIYAVIVAGWAALLAPRWIRRNEEIERAREADAARGVRVLERRQGRVRGGHVSASARALGRSSFSGRSAPGASSARMNARPEARSSEAQPSESAPPRPSARHSATSRDVPAPAERHAETTTVQPTPQVSAAVRRRRTLTLLTMIMAGVLALAMSGTISVWWTAVPFVLLLTFVLVARRAVVIENRRARAARIAARRRELAEPPPKRRAVYEPDESASQDPDAWTPQPVPRPTYLSKPKASPPQGRKIDLSGSGSWTSGRLERPDEQDYPGRRAQAPRNRPGGDDFDDRRAHG